MSDTDARQPWLDFDGAPTPAPARPLAHSQRAWRARDIDPAQCLIVLDKAALAELRSLVEQLRAAPLPVLLRHPGQFKLPALRQVMERVREELVAGSGVAVLDRLALEQMSSDDALAIYWCLGNLLGRTVAQKWDGTMLYDVTDTGAAFGYGVRGSYTSVELVFHTDNAFGSAPPEFVGLLCLRPAVRGGVSRFCSLVAVHDELQRGAPQLLARLYQPMLWDRQAEHAPQASKVARGPMFRLTQSGLRARANPGLVRMGYELAGQRPDPLLEEALAAFKALTDDPAFWFELPIERGQIQYLNNIDIAHYRSEFDDHDDPALKRHLVRTWHRDSGSPVYDG